MKKFLMHCLCASFAFGAEYSFDPQKVDEGLWCVYGDLNPPTKENKGFVSNVCWVENGKELVLLDAGPTTVFAKELEKVIATTTKKKISHVVLTNYHDDRILAASYFQSQGAKTVAHKNILSEIEQNPQKYERLVALLTKEQYAQTKLPTIDITFDTPSYKLGSIELLKLSEIAETASDIVIYMPKQKAIFTGNILFGERALNYDKHSHINGWLEALETIKSMDILYHIPGHGTKVDDSSFTTTQKYLQSLYTQTKQAYEDDVELDEISSVVVMEEFSSLVSYKQRHVLNLYNLYEDLEFEIVE